MPWPPCPRPGSSNFFIRTCSNTFAQHLLSNTYFFLEREHLCSGREALCSHLHIWWAVMQRCWQGLEQGEVVGERDEDLTLTWNHRDAGFHQPLLTWSRIWAAQQERGKFSPSGSCSEGDLRPVHGDELGRFAVPVTQGPPSRNSGGSSQSTLNLWMALG